MSVGNIYLNLGPKDFPFSSLSFVLMLPLYSYAAISMRFGLKGPNETICTACAAGTHAITWHFGDEFPGDCGPTLVNNVNYRSNDWYDSQDRHQRQHAEA